METDTQEDTIENSENNNISSNSTPMLFDSTEISSQCLRRILREYVEPQIKIRIREKKVENLINNTGVYCEAEENFINTFSEMRSQVNGKKDTVIQRLPTATAAVKLSKRSSLINRNKKRAMRKSCGESSETAFNGDNFINAVHFIKKGRKALEKEESLNMIFPENVLQLENGQKKYSKSNISNQKEEIHEFNEWKSGKTKYGSPRIIKKQSSEKSNTTNSIMDKENVVQELKPKPQRCTPISKYNKKRIISDIGSTKEKKSLDSSLNKKSSAIKTDRLRKFPTSTDNFSHNSSLDIKEANLSSVDRNKIIPLSEITPCNNIQNLKTKTQNHSHFKNFNNDIAVAAEIDDHHVVISSQSIGSVNTFTMRNSNISDVEEEEELEKVRKLFFNKEKIDKYMENLNSPMYGSLSEDVSNKSKEIFNKEVLKGNFWITDYDGNVINHKNMKNGKDGKNVIKIENDKEKELLSYTKIKYEGTSKNIEAEKMPETIKVKYKIKNASKSENKSETGDCYSKKSDFGEQFSNEKRKTRSTKKVLSTENQLPCLIPALTSILNLERFNNLKQSSRIKSRTKNFKTKKTIFESCSKENPQFESRLVINDLYNSIKLSSGVVIDNIINNDSEMKVKMEGHELFNNESIFGLTTKKDLLNNKSTKKIPSEKQEENKIKIEEDKKAKLFGESSDQNSSGARRKGLKKTQVSIK